MKDKKFKLLIYGMMVLAVLMFLLVSRKARAALFISSFIFLNMIIMSYKKFIRLPIEIEVLTFGIVLTTVEFGLSAGLVVGILGGILGFFVGLEISPFAFPMFIGYIFMAFIAFALRDYNITLVGLITTLANNVLIFSIYHFVFRYDLFKNSTFALSNIMLNAVLFYNIAPLIQEIMF